MWIRREVEIIMNFLITEKFLIWSHTPSGSPVSTQRTHRHTTEVSVYRAIICLERIYLFIYCWNRICRCSRFPPSTNSTNTIHIIFDVLRFRRILCDALFSFRKCHRILRMCANVCTQTTSRNNTKSFVLHRFKQQFGVCVCVGCARPISLEE